MTTNKSRTPGMRSRNTGARPRQGVASRELQEARRKRRQREVLRNRIIFGISLIAFAVLFIFIIVKLISAIFSSGKASDTSKLTFTADKQVVFEEITDFDTDTYSKSEFKGYVKDLIESYNDTYGSKAITLNKLKVSGSKAYVKTTYKDAECYSSFTSYNTYNGSYTDAIESGYDFAALFSQVADDKLLEASVVNADEVFADSSVAVVNENVTVTVPGDITYVSNGDVTLVDSDTITISQADGNADATDLVYIIYSNK
ncbi:hypothetical protein [Pseudobutyrivibrio sp.]